MRARGDGVPGWLRPPDESLAGMTPGEKRAGADAVATGTRAWFERSADRLVPRPLQGHREQVLYLVVGGWNTLAGYGAFAILYYLLESQPSYAVIIFASYAFAITNAYLGYRYIAFRSHANVLREFPRFSAVYVATMIVNLAFFPLALQVLPMGAYAVQALFTAGVVVASYLAHKHFSFRHPPSDARALSCADTGRSAASQETGLDGPVSGGE